MGGLLGDPEGLKTFLGGGPMTWVVNAFSITRWSIQMSFVGFYEELQPKPTGLEDQYMLDSAKSVYLLGDAFQVQWSPVLALLAMGGVLRLASYLGLRFMHRDKQV